MTGYGKSSFETKGKIVTVEIKSLNSKQCDLFIKSPSMYREAELDIRNIVTQKLERGKIEVFINVEYPENYSALSINKAMFYKYYDELTLLANDTKDKTREFLPVIMKLPDIMKQAKAEVDNNEIKSLLDIVEKAIYAIDEYRINEGKAMLADFENRIKSIMACIPEIEKREQQRLDAIKSKIFSKLLQVETELNIDKNRFEQELLYYIEKIDFTEEKVRLKQHCDFFLETIMEETANGKKLLFIVQEIGREVNTLGSKANNFDIQKIVVEMKDEMEKIKEQMLNVL